MMTDDEIVTIAHIREALGVGAKPMLSDLPAIAAELRKDAERFRWYVSNETLDEAKAKCQRHFEETVMACLEAGASDDSSVAALALRAMQATADDNCEDIWWRTDGDYAPITIFASCNDLFYWACSDHEKVTQEDIHVFEQAYKDSPKNGAILFCCRMRGMRPQGAYYKYIEPSEKHFFDACGPRREVDIGNPHDQSEYDSDQAT